MFCGFSVIRLCRIGFHLRGDICLFGHFGSFLQGWSCVICFDFVGKCCAGCFKRCRDHCGFVFRALCMVLICLLRLLCALLGCMVVVRRGFSILYADLSCFVCF